ncbi:hypothetical protein GCM10022222_64630 [Amycolatopsis ultiminotia]|uniref:Uncharacterized protein n=1 Tax=Amycolatopsis ultiminotia TaxID=543629 RepID=A0ABP6XT05_9PSEU
MHGQYGPAARQLPRDPYPGAEPSRRPGGATAIAAGLLGLVAAVAAGYLPVTQFIDIPSGFSLGDLPRWTLVDLGGFLCAALVLLIGSLAVFFRAVTGAVLLILGAVLAIAAILLEPTLDGGSYAGYFRAVSRLDGPAAIDRAVLVVTVPLVLLLTALPPTFRHLRFRTR